MLSAEGREAVADVRSTYRRNWAKSRHSARGWLGLSVPFCVYVGGGVALAVSPLNDWLRLFGTLLALVSLAPFGVCLLRAVQVRREHADGTGL
jgi:hypothetical protein